MSDQQSKEHLTARLAAADSEAVRLRTTIVVLECYRMEYERITARVAVLEAAAQAVCVAAREDLESTMERLEAALADVPAAAGGEEGT